MSSPIPPAVEAEDPFRLGWRYVRETTAEGQEVTRQVPLTERDLLFPQEGDQVMQRDPHTRDIAYLRDALRTLLRDRLAIKVLADFRIDFNLPDVEPLGPDVTVIDGIEHWDDQCGTIHLAHEGRPLLVVEVTSPNTRDNDFGVKRRYYQRAGVPVYVIVDHHPPGDDKAVSLLVLRLDDGGYREVRPQGNGIVRLPQLRLGIGLHENRVWIYDHRGRRFEETPELYQENQTLRADLEVSDSRSQELEAQYEQQLDLRRQETAARAEAERQRDEAIRHLEAERKARLALEERLRRLEAQPRARPEGDA